VRRASSSSQGVPLAQVGKLLVWPSALTFFGKMINAAWESRMTAAGQARGEAETVTLLRIRKVRRPSTPHPDTPSTMHARVSVAS
jgi:hypothetical protein